jgi:protein CpxP
MKNAIRHIAAPTVLALAFMTSSVFAQTATPSAPASPAPAASSGHKHGHGHGRKHGRDHASFIEKRINDLHSALNITAAQSSQWDAFAQTMRDSAKKTDDAYRDRAQKLPSLNADDAMKSYAAITQLRADNTQKLTTAFSALYATLSADQKNTADVMFRYQRAKRHAGMRGQRAGKQHAHRHHDGQHADSRHDGAPKSSMTPLRPLTAPAAK